MAFAGPAGAAAIAEGGAVAFVEPFVAAFAAAAAAAASASTASPFDVVHNLPVAGQSN